MFNQSEKSKKMSDSLNRCLAELSEAYEDLMNTPGELENNEINPLIKLMNDIYELACSLSGELSGIGIDRRICMPHGLAFPPMKKEIKKDEQSEH